MNVKSLRAWPFGRIAVALVLVQLAAGCAVFSSVYGRADRAPVISYVAATSRAEASEAAGKVLGAGGSAVDAAIAAAFVIGLVEPQSSGLGGGGFLVHYEAASGRITTYEGRETAPAATRADQFLSGEGTPLGFMDRAVGGRSVGVPGLVPMLKLAHDAHGRMPWDSLGANAQALAAEGFEVSPRLSRLLGEVPRLAENPALRAYLFSADGRPLPPGTMIRNEAYGRTLGLVAEDPAALNHGPLAEAIMEAASAAQRSPQTITGDDLKGYTAKERAPVCGPYRAYLVCGMGPPSSGGITLLQMLAYLEPHDLDDLPADDPAVWHLFAEAMALAFADRGEFLADPDFVDVPVKGLLDKDYLSGRARLVDPAKWGGVRAPGAPRGARQERAAASTMDVPSTAHMTITDGQGNIAALTTSIEFAFGSQILVEGFLLNNQLTDFSAIPARDGVAVANAAAPGKRPLSSMAPTIVLDADGRPVLAIGSAGGQRIIADVAKTIVAVVDLGLSLDEAIALPNLANRNGVTEIEAGPAGEALAAGLRARGHTVELKEMASGLQGIRFEGRRAIGAADPRREGRVSSARRMSLSE